MNLLEFSRVNGQDFFQLYVLFSDAVVRRLSSAVDLCFVKKSLYLVLELSVLRFYSF